jgi:predicted dehydrogenase
MNIRVLIIGFGKMGHIYSKYLDEFGVKWFYYDPFVTGGLKKLIRINNYSHTIISTPPENHYESYRMIVDMGFEGRIYIDKPVITSDEHLDVLDNKNVFCGMTERYNPVVVALKELLNLESLISIKFSRYSTAPDNMKTPVLFDLGIHDLDLYLYLLDCDKLAGTHSIFEKSKTCYIMFRQNDILSMFEWSHESHKRERKIVVLQKDTVYETDLIDQTIVSYEVGGVIRNLYVAKAQPLKKVVRSFLKGDQCNAKLSHEFMLDIMLGLE